MGTTRVASLSSWPTSYTHLFQVSKECASLWLHLSTHSGALGPAECLQLVCLVNPEEGGMGSPTCILKTGAFST